MSFHSEVTLSPWTPDWEKRFETEKAAIERAFKGMPSEIRHTGSTSIRGMRSKPIVDVLITVPDDRSLIDYEEALADSGYLSLGECGREDRVFLVKGDSPENAFYVHLTYRENPVARDQLLFQYIERAVPEIARAYMTLKCQMAEQYPKDRRKYTESKSPFISSVLAAYRLGAMRLEYGGIMGSIEYSETDGVFYGKAQNVDSLISYQGEDIIALEQDFRDAVDDFLSASAADENI